MNKSDIFTGCYFHTLKISSVIFTVWKYKLLWHHIMNRMQHPRFERNMLKKHGKCNNKQKVQFLMLNMEFILLVRQNLKNIFIFCHKWKKFRIQHHTIEYPLYISTDILSHCGNINGLAYHVVYLHKTTFN